MDVEVKLEELLLQPVECLRVDGAEGFQGLVVCVQGESSASEINRKVVNCPCCRCKLEEIRAVVLLVGLVNKDTLREDLICVASFWAENNGRISLLYYSLQLAPCFTLAGEKATKQTK